VSMMNCKDLCDFIAAYFDGELPDEQAEVFKKHLDLCPPCRDYLNTYRATIDCEKKVCREEEKQMCNQVPEELVQAILKARK